MKSSGEWREILTACGVKPETATRWAPIFEREIQEETFRADEDLAAFLGQVVHESGHLERLVENLNYGVERMMAVWPRRFPTHAGARPYDRNPQALAEKVYGGRLGNDEPGDGARYIGRGLLQVTGKDNYRAVSVAIGVDLVGTPDLLAQPDIALRASIAWWKKNIPASIVCDVELVTKRVNGGTVGLAERMALTNAAAEALA